MRIRTTAVAAAIAVLAVAGAAPATASYHAGDLPTLPQLVVASLVRTTTAAQATATRPAGTTMTFQFDEPLDAAASAATTGDFAVYHADGTPVHPSRAEVEGDTVTLLFPRVDTKAEAYELRLATVRSGAVTGTDGDLNPNGAMPVEVPGYATFHGPSGCVKLSRVDDVTVKGANTKVSFAFVCYPSGRGGSRTWTVTPSRFHLQMVDGSVRTGTKDLSADTEQDTGVVTMLFPGRLRSTQIARGTVDDNAVHIQLTDVDGSHEDDADYVGALQAAHVSHQGKTVRPDLVRVQLQHNSDRERPDHAVYVFDQKVRDPHAERFVLAWGARAPGGRAYGTHARVVKGHPARVRVTFAPHAADYTRDAWVESGAVRGGRADEIGVWNHKVPVQHSRIPATAAPDLGLAVRVSVTDSAVTYRLPFDSTLTGTAVTSAFHLYQRDGVRLDATDCTLAVTPGIDTVSSVECVFPRGTYTSPDGTYPYSLVTVDAGAVHDGAGRANPEHWSTTTPPDAVG